MRFELIEQAKKDFSVQRLCQVVRVSQSGYFAWQSRLPSRRQREDRILLAHVRSAFSLSNGTYGNPRMTRELRDQGLVVGLRRTTRLMRDNGLRTRQKQRFKRTTGSVHAWPIAPNLLAAPGIVTGTIAEMLIVLGDNAERIRSEAAFAKLCGVCPIPASSGNTTRHRLNRGGNRHANAALHRVAVVRMRSHSETKAYVQRRTAEGKSLREIRRCLKRYIAREVFNSLCEPAQPEAGSDVA